MANPRKIHDLTALFQTYMPVWPSTPLPTVEPVGIVARDGYSIERITSMTHAGTHMDAPYHFLEDGATVDRIPPEQLVGSAVMLDVRKDAEGTIVSQKSVEKRWPKGMHPDFVLFQTGWSRDRAPTKHYLYDFPGISPEAAEWLVHKSVKGVGTDALGIDPYANSKFEAHKVLLRKGIWILEALDHLEDLSERVEYTLIAAPLKIAGASGAMARVFAIEG